MSGDSRVRLDVFSLKFQRIVSRNSETADEMCDYCQNYFLNGGRNFFAALKKYHLFSGKFDF